MAAPIAFPLVGPVQVRGKTTRWPPPRIAAALANGYMRNPDVAVEIETYRPFFIQGAVKNGGQFPYVYGMTVRAAISTAGGFTDTADRSRVIIYRQQGKEMVKGAVDLDFPIYPGRHDRRLGALALVPRSCPMAEAPLRILQILRAPVGGLFRHVTT